MKAPDEIDRKINKGCFGCVLLLVVLGLVGSLLSHCERSERANIPVVFGTATITNSVLSSSTAKFAGQELAQTIYGIAKQRSDIKKLEVTVEMGVIGGVIDKYGNPVKGPLIMGTIRVEDMDEVRRYKDETAYGMQTGALYEAQLLDMKYSYFFSK